MQYLKLAHGIGAPFSNTAGTMARSMDYKARDRLLVEGHYNYFIVLNKT